MSSSEPEVAGVTNAMASVMLCDMLLDLACQSYSRIAQARRIAQVLNDAMPHMNKAQEKIARGRVRELETRWGPMLYGASSPDHATQKISQEISPEYQIALWLVRRKTPDRMLRVIARAVNFIGEEPRRLTEVMDYAFQLETDHVLIPVGYQTFKEWMIELRVGTPSRVQGRVWYSRGEWFSVWEEISAQLDTVGNIESKQPYEQDPPVGSSTPHVGAKKAAVVPGTKPKVGALQMVRMEMRKIEKARATQAARVRKRAGKKWAQTKKLKT